MPAGLPTSFELPRARRVKNIKFRARGLRFKPRRAVGAAMRVVGLRVQDLEFMGLGDVWGVRSNPKKGTRGFEKWDLPRKVQLSTHIKILP